MHSSNPQVGQVRLEVALMGHKRKHGNKDGKKAGVGGAAEEEALAEYEFVWVSGEHLRLVRPYKYCFRTFAKERWLGRSLYEVCTAEFGAYTPEYYRDAIVDGRIKIAGEMVSPDYVLCNGDAITHETIRHEPPVLVSSRASVAKDTHDESVDKSNDEEVVPIAVVGKTEELVAVDKPATMPVHPSGAYHHNTLLHILAHEQPQWRRGASCMLHTVHRLDRLTSGLVLLATSPAVARRVCAEIIDGKVRKEYLARVRGHFPSATRLDQMPSRWRAASVSQTEQVGEVYLDPQEQSNDIASRSSVAGSKQGLDVACSGGGPTSGLAYTSFALSPCSSVRFACPIRCVSHRDGKHECHPDGKHASTVFKCLGYDSASDTSLVRCTPLTGRTHQIRVHLQQLDYPIANDPCYGGCVSSSVEKDALGNMECGNDPAEFGDDMRADPTSGSCTSGHRVGDPAPGFTETQLRCRGIWLHALRYSGPGFSFGTSMPLWASCFNVGKEALTQESSST